MILLAMHPHTYCAAFVIAELSCIVLCLPVAVHYKQPLSADCVHLVCCV